MIPQPSNEPIEEKSIPAEKPVDGKPVPTPVKAEEKGAAQQPPPDPDEKGSPMDFVTQEPYRSSPLFYEIANYFGIEEREYDGAKDQLSVIVDWAVEEGKSAKSEDILLNIRKLEDNIQNPSWGEKRHANVYRYLRLASRAQALKKAMSAYEKGGL